MLYALFLILNKQPQLLDIVDLILQFIISNTKSVLDLKLVLIQTFDETLLFTHNILVIVLFIRIHIVYLCHEQLRILFKSTTVYNYIYSFSFKVGRQ